MGVLRIMSARSGDDAVTWGGTKVEDAVEMSETEVQEKFDQLVKQGFSVFDTKNESRAKGFDSQVEEYVAVPNIQGG